MDFPALLLSGLTHTLVELARSLSEAEPVIDAARTSPEYVGRAGMIGDRQQTLKKKYCSNS